MTDKIWLSEPFDLNEFWVRHLAPQTKRYNIIKKTARKTLGSIKAHRATEDAIETLTNIIIDKFVDEVRTGEKVFDANGQADAYLQKVTYGWCRSFAMQAFRNEYYDPETSKAQSEVQLVNSLGLVKRRKRDANGKYQYSPLKRPHGGYVSPEDLTQAEEADPDLSWNKDPDWEYESLDELAHIMQVSDFYADDNENYDSQYEGVWRNEDHLPDEDLDPLVYGFGRHVEGRSWTIWDAQALLEGDASAAAYINRVAFYGQHEASTMATEAKEVTVGRKQKVIEAPTFVSQKIEYAPSQAPRSDPLRARSLAGVDAMRRPSRAVASLR